MIPFEACMEKKMQHTIVLGQLITYSSYWDRVAERNRREHGKDKS
jgi:hypothetical protein